MLRLTGARFVAVHGDMLRRISVIVLVVTGFLTLGSTRADAVPTGCSTGPYFSQGAYAYCSGGSGSYRIRIRCDASWWPDYTRYGPWRNVGSGLQSIAVCDLNDDPYDRTLQAFGPN